jgi:hypothetical protein
MAKYKSTRTGSKSFFTMVVLASSALMLIIATTLLVQKPTDTQSHASGSGCKVTPTFTSAGSKDGGNYVVYSYNVINPNPTSCKIPIYYFVNIFPLFKNSDNWSIDYRVNNGDWTLNAATGTLKSGQSVVVKGRVRPPSSAKSKAYSFTAQACDGFLTGPGEPVEPGNKCVTKGITYVKD